MCTAVERHPQQVLPHEPSPAIRVQSTIINQGSLGCGAGLQARRAGLNKVATKQWESDADLEASEQHGHGNKVCLFYPVYSSLSVSLALQ